MQEVWQAHSEDPQNFDLDEFNHPWSEQGETRLRPNLRGSEVVTS